MTSLLIVESEARGGPALFGLLKQLLAPCWQSHFNRYVVNLNVNTTPQKTEPSIPFNYLYNLAIRSAHHRYNGSSITLSNQEYCQLAVDVCAVLGVEPFNWAEVSLRSESRLVQLLGILGLFQHIFVLTQSDETNVAQSLAGLFDWIDDATEAHLGWSLTDAIHFAGTVIASLPTEKGGILIKKGLLAGRAGFDSEKFERLWHTFTSQNATANASFAAPTDATSANAMFKPMIEVDDGAVIGLRSVSAASWYEALAMAVRTIDQQADQKIGERWERYVRDKLAQYGVVYSGSFSSTVGEGEIDAAITTDEVILLFELKKKPLTRIAQTGSTLDALIDLTKSIIRAQGQLAKIECVLFSDGVV